MDYSPLVPKLVNLAIEIQQIPAPTFAEQQRGNFIYNKFLSEELSEVSRDSMGNIYAKIPGVGEKSPIVVSAHIDTVFPESEKLPIIVNGNRVFGPGIGDNSLGVAGLFGLAWMLKQPVRSEHGQEEYNRNLTLPGDIWLVANVGEEGLGDLSGIRAVVERFKEHVLAYIVLEGMALGQVYHRALGVQRYRIVVETPGGHSWVDYGRPSAIHELAKIINLLTQIAMPLSPRASLNIGMIEGGTSINTIAPYAHCELDLRSESATTLAELVIQVEDLVKNSNKHQVRVLSELIGKRPAGNISVNHPLIQIAVDQLVSLGIQPVLSIGSTDANIPLSRGLASVCLGLTTGNGAHTKDEYIDIQPIRNGLAQLVGIVKQAFQVL